MYFWTDNNNVVVVGLAFGYQNGELMVIINGSSWVIETTVDVFPT